MLEHSSSTRYNNHYNINDHDAKKFFIMYKSVGYERCIILYVIFNNSIEVESKMGDAIQVNNRRRISYSNDRERA